MQVPVLTTGIIDQDLDFTVMFWFKVDLPSDPKPGQKRNEIMNLFSFEESAACIITQNLSILCDSATR